METPLETAPWFKEGLKFQCTGCGKCCTGEDGYVFLNEEDLERLASFHSLSLSDFSRRFCRFVEGKLALLDLPRSGGDCVFLKENKCSVYEARPTQCRTFPWWIHNLRSREDWEEAGARCEGIDREEAPVIPREDIELECMTYLDSLLTQNFGESAWRR